MTRQNDSVFSANTNEQVNNYIEQQRNELDDILFSIFDKRIELIATLKCKYEYDIKYLETLSERELNVLLERELIANNSVQKAWAQPYTIMKYERAIENAPSVKARNIAIEKLEVAKAFYSELSQDLTSIELKRAQASSLNAYKRLNRVRERLQDIVIDGNAFFITFTFDDETLKRTNKDTRRQRVRRTLKEISELYVANIDYGKDNGREHYHAIMQFNGSARALRKAIKGLYDYGKINVKPISATIGANERTTRYIVKLTHHALKVTTKRERVIYSRVKK